MKALIIAALALLPIVGDGETININAMLTPDCTVTGTVEADPGFFSVNVAGSGSGCFGIPYRGSITYTTYVTVLGGVGTGTATYVPGGFQGPGCGDSNPFSECTLNPNAVGVPFTYGIAAPVTITADYGFDGFVDHDFDKWGANAIVEIVRNQDGTITNDFTYSFSDGPNAAPEPSTWILTLLPLALLPVNLPKRKPPNTQ